MARWTTADIPNQTGRVAVITGANTGLGYETAAALAAKGAHVALAVRDLDKGKNAATRITQRNPRASFELQFGTNHLGHFALTGLLLDRLLPVAGSRGVTVSSTGHRVGRIRFDDLQWERRYSRMGAYGQSKLANLLFTYELQRRLTGTHTLAAAAHPGASRTELARNTPPSIRVITGLFELTSQDAAMGALPTLRAATDPGVLGGQYYGPGGFAELRGYPRVVASNGRSHDVDAQKRLWAVSEKLTGVRYPVD
ncbi:MAG: SDR family NAD(P)-dependent oxidoreductase [Mycolicibacterium sp.]|nr:SDR family NAD(P)-dependent oxidoreductase [Mycolicibacterium sp.]